MSRLLCALSRNLSVTPRKRRPERSSWASAGGGPRCRPAVEALEHRLLLTSRTFTLNDPDFPTQQWGSNNVAQPNSFLAAGGKYGLDIDMPAAWSVTTGKMTTVLAVIDDGVDYTNPDVYLNIWLNQGEIPAALRPSLTDTDGDGLITFRDLNQPANAPYVRDLNGNGYIDGGDLLKDPRWADGQDGDSNGKVDDLIGWDFQDNDNDPMPGATGGHGTQMAQRIGGIPNNGIGMAGVNWQISMMPVRIHPDGNNINYTNAAAGLDYAVAEGASISNNSWDSTTYSQTMYDAVNRAKAAGHLFVAASGNLNQNSDITPLYPAAFNLDNIVSAMIFDPWGNPGGNYGATSVDLAAPTPAATSGASANTAGVAALLKTLHPDWNYVQLKSRILSTVDPSPALAGITVSGGRLNAAFALAQTAIAIDTPAVAEGNSGTAPLVFTLRRVGDSTGTVTVNWSTSDGTAKAGSDYVAASGQVTFLPGGSNTQTITVNVLGDTTLEPSETLYINLQLASGTALLADSDGQGTILDDDANKFFVVDDASSTDRTYRYAVPGNTLGNATLTTGDSAPRGIAANATGTKLWVVDANKTVYVYSASGGLLGSWTPGSVSRSAQLTGIATNGTDVWLVDKALGVVYDYAGAASRTSGKQNAASSFSLASGNTNPQDMVTDGTSFWVVDGTSLQVFKYTLSGSLLGSWAIDPANAHPTGIAINPNNVSDVWIVDSGTKKVYQYAGAAYRHSGGSQAAAATFPLAAGNTNPQGIADPPPADTPLTPADLPLALGQPSVTASSAVPAGRPSAVAGAPAPATRDVVFALLAQSPLANPGAVVPPRPDSATPAAVRAPAPAVTSARPNLLDPSTPPWSAVDWLDGALTHDRGPVEDAIPAGLGDDAPPEE